MYRNDDEEKKKEVVEEPIDLTRLADDLKLLNEQLASIPVNLSRL